MFFKTNVSFQQKNRKKYRKPPGQQRQQNSHAAYKKYNSIDLNNQHFQTNQQEKYYIQNLVNEFSEFTQIIPCLTGHAPLF